MFITGPSIIESPLVPPALGAVVPSQWERHSFCPPSPLKLSNKCAQTLTPVVHLSLYSKLLSKIGKRGHCRPQGLLGLVSWFGPREERDALRFE